MIQLTTPFASGAFDSQDYTHARIGAMSCNRDEKSFIVTVVLGYISNGEFVHGVQLDGTTVRSYTIKDIPGDEPVTDYWTMTTKTVGPTAGATIYSRLLEEMDQYLLDKGYFQGTIVEG